MLKLAYLKPVAHFKVLSRRLEKLASANSIPIDTIHFTWMQNALVYGGVHGDSGYTDNDSLQSGVAASVCGLHAV